MSATIGRFLQMDQNMFQSAMRFQPTVLLRHANLFHAQLATYHARLLFEFFKKAMTKCNSCQTKIFCFVILERPGYMRTSKKSSQHNFHLLKVKQDKKQQFKKAICCLLNSYCTSSLLLVERHCCPRNPFYQNNDEATP